MGEPVACRLHPELNRELEKIADERRTTKARLVEEWVTEKIEEFEDESESEESLPEGVYRPNSDKHDYAVKWRDHAGNTRRDYYKTREGAREKVERVRSSGGSHRVLSD
jgi:predicted DNA-binding protein